MLKLLRKSAVSNQIQCQEILGGFVYLTSHRNPRKSKDQFYLYETAIKASIYIYAGFASIHNPESFVLNTNGN